jgi:hypothetical protein
LHCQGFNEEREWRVFHSPSYEPEGKLIYEIQDIGGTPQPIQKVILKDDPDKGIVGIEIPELIDKVIIGPTQYPWMMQEAFAQLLFCAGIQPLEAALRRVVVSHIPLRR